MMKPISIIFAVITLVLVAFQLLCGLWLAAKGTTPDGVLFHRNLGIGASLAAIITAVITLFLSSMKFNLQ